MRELKQYFLKYDLIKELSFGSDCNRYEYIMDCFKFISKLIDEPDLNKAFYYLLEHLESKKYIQIEVNYKRNANYILESYIKSDFLKDEFCFLDITSDEKYVLFNNWDLILEKLDILNKLQDEFK